MSIPKFHMIDRFSLAFLWIFTAVTSLFISKETGYEILASGGISGTAATIALYSGSALDFVIGIWLLSGYRLRLCYLIQIITILVFTLLVSVIDPSFWFHPFGPITKNIPILAMVYYLYYQSTSG